MDLPLLEAITIPCPIATLSSDALKQLQAALGCLGYPVGAVDGIIGPRTLNAWAEFKTDVHSGNPTMIGPGSVQTLVQKTRRPVYNLSNKSSTIAAIKAECGRQGIGLPAQVAYVLATVQWETNNQFAPVGEDYWQSTAAREAYLKSKDYYPFYGRGYVQLTWDYNYRYYGDILQINLFGDPDLALDPQVALFILVHGFKTGAFTGRAITDYIDANRTDFYDARRCINGTDQATAIAAFADKYLQGTAVIA